MKLSSRQVQQIQQGIESALDRQLQIKTLKTLLNSLNRYSGIEVEIETDFEQQFLKTLDITIQIKPDLKEVFLTTFSNYQPTLQDSSDDNNENVVINLRTHQPLSDEAFEQLENAIKKYQKSEQRTHNIYQLPPSMEKPTAPPQKAKPTKQGKEEQEQQSERKIKPTGEKPQQPTKKIVWPSGTYDPNNNDNKIKPIKERDGTYRNHYALFNIREKDCPQGSFKKFRNVIHENPQFVRNKGGKGAQGLIPKPGQYVKNAKGKLVPAISKAKAIGSAGDPRFFAYAEIAPNGARLHVYVPENISPEGPGH